ncbi:uncharacterized protein N0V89_008731 [Didymosphaeria variabile]|uniref:Ribonuclease H2 subunit B n=1 Tax=Didymosphaeria variabile TaxID=1932322 RepID=A0A9W8XGU5_9PLEO|nr:uncharacterized protein N0V89_008731 [Didymosphaeria variabile]KAJ4350110.1 hypothetical protein N0V89_008731 [Didymosphaeria variabile]
MARTRSKPKPKPTTAKETTPEPPQSTTKPLPPSTTNPPKLFVLPKDTSLKSRIVTLENPANGAPSRYYFCPSMGFYEFTRIAAPKKDCKSWLITPNKTTDNELKDQHAKEETTTQEMDTGAGLGGGYVTNKADIFLATPIDLLFVVLPALAPKAGAKQGEKQHFLSFEDHLDTLASISRQWKVLLSQHQDLKDMIERRMATVSDTVTAGGETMYRLSHEKLIKVLTKKAERMCAKGLPPSMEEKFIKTVLEVPVMNVLRSDTFTTTSTPAPSDTQTTTSSPIPDFSSLDTHLASLAKLRAEALALRSISDNISRKRGHDEDEGAIMEREEKKRKKEEEEKKKKGESRAVKQLKKVDTSGMKKLSSFFTKAGKKS